MCVLINVTKTSQSIDVRHSRLLDVLESYSIRANVLKSATQLNKQT